MIDAVSDDVSSSRVGESVWCFGALGYRPFGTAAEYVVVSSEQAVSLSGGVSFEQGACWICRESPPRSGRRRVAWS